MFKTNEGSADRIIRVVVGVVLLALFFLNPDAGWRWWTMIGLIPLVTGLVGTCPIYMMLGISTASKDK